MLTGDYETPALLASAISQGDKKAETVLCEEFYEGTLYLLERKTRDLALAQDLCQEAFWKLLQRLRLGPLEEPDNIVGYLYTIATNLYYEEYRKTKRRKTFTDQALIELVADKWDNQYRQLIKERKGEGVRRVITLMSNSRDRKLLYALFIEEKDKAEVCAELGLSSRHFDRVLYRAKERFKEVILNYKTSP